MSTHSTTKIPLNVKSCGKFRHIKIARELSASGYAVAPMGLQGKPCRRFITPQERGI